jgi:hypothetical protein
MYGDFTPTNLPVNVKDVIALFPEAVSAISSGGVPISVILQPIPPSLIAKVNMVNALEDLTVNTLLDTCGSLEDLNNRFSSLLENVNQWSDIVPKLKKAVVKAQKDFASAKTHVLSKLKSYLKKATAGKTADPKSVLDPANVIIQKNGYHATDNSILPPKYPESLTGLERAFTRFTQLVSAVSSHTGMELKSIATISKNLDVDTDAMLFISWHVGSSDIPIFSSLIGLGYAMYGDKKPCYALYAEDSSKVNDNGIPGGSQVSFTDSSGSSLYEYTIKDSHTITWTKVSWDDLAKTPSGPKLYTGDVNLLMSDIRK